MYHQIPQKLLSKFVIIYDIEANNEKTYTPIQCSIPECHTNPKTTFGHNTCTLASPGCV